MTDREIMEQALDALDLLSRVPKAKRDYADRAIVALRERLAQPEQEPVSGVVLDEHGSAALVNNGAEEWHCKKHNARRLYTTPPQRKPEQEPVVKWDASAPLVVHPHPAFQAAPLQRKPEQELVIDCPRCGHCCPPQGIYYTPPQRKPLTDAVLAEREACAALVDANAMACENPIYRSLLQANAQAIREMGQP